MLPILCFGEALIDALQTGSVEVDGVSLPQFTHFPGGAPANVAVAVAKLGGDAHFAGQVGNDRFGHFLKAALERYGVKTSQLFLHPQAATAIAFVLLDNEGERSFSFYRENTADLLFTPEVMTWDQFHQPGILHLCSNTLTTEAICQASHAIIDRAKAKGWKISFDINYRHNLWLSPELAPERVVQVIEKADLVKTSGEELDLLFADSDRFALCQSWAGERLVVLTDGGERVSAFFQQHHWQYDVPVVDVVDTTSAGDSFVGGLLFQLAKASEWNEKVCQNALGFAIRCGAITVTRQGAYPALPWAEEID